jgi:hypothetical protein
MICPRVTLQRLDGSLCDGPDHGRNCAKFCYQDNEIRKRLFKRYADSLEILGMVDTVLSPSRFLIDAFTQSEKAAVIEILMRKNGRFSTRHVVPRSATGVFARDLLSRRNTLEK